MSLFSNQQIPKLFYYLNAKATALGYQKISEVISEFTDLLLLSTSYYRTPPHCTSRASGESKMWRAYRRSHNGNRTEYRFISQSWTRAFFPLSVHNLSGKKKHERYGTWTQCSIRHDGHFCTWPEALWCLLSLSLARVGFLLWCSPILKGPLGPLDRLAAEKMNWIYCCILLVQKEDLKY